MLTLVRGSIILLASPALANVLSIDAGLAPTRAAVVTWNLNTPTGTLGTSQNYTQSGITITAADFTRLAQRRRFSGKTTPEMKRSRIEYRTDHEINLTNFIRINFSNAKPLTSDFMLKMGSSTNGEDWEVYGPATALTSLAGATSLLTGSDEITHTLTGHTITIISQLTTKHRMITSYWLLSAGLCPPSPNLPPGP